MIKMRKKISGLIDRLVPISESNKGQASKIFERLQTDRSLVIIKNNAPVGQCHLDKAVQVEISMNQRFQLLGHMIEESFYLYFACMPIKHYITIQLSYII